jgi:hypothetical protein
MGDGLVRYLSAIAGLVVATTLVLGGNATAETATVNSSTTGSLAREQDWYITVLHQGGSDNESASFPTTGFADAITLLAQSLACTAKYGETASCGGGSYASNANGATPTEAHTGKRELPHSSVANHQIDQRVEHGGSADHSVMDTAHVLAISAAANTSILDAPVSGSSGRAVGSAHQGAVTVSLVARSGGSTIRSAEDPIVGVAGSQLASLTIYDAATLIANSNGRFNGVMNSDNGVQNFVVNAVQSGSGHQAQYTTYWIDLSNSASAPPVTDAAWEFVNDTGITASDLAGTDIVGYYWDTLFYEHVQPE